ncbi:type II toxin-antitoxin system death-on-curing family toxin [Arsenophonus nasoniae]|uniref:Type II toxin-antitoxin system death-on-curing family toxin n=1 Tax=Arsenophonus nasoniae TaxID=638 RepID=A0AA95KCI9_9GAMM|nr:type II toxin-antitoxin system death-on-curing family toxin [Arsenophonus nasoniae]WGM00503.1 type II toxin-antitoxin system death-on-curing family toxin [Arsenophonus nasoniae]
MPTRFLTTEEVIKIQRSTLPNSGRPNIDRLEGALHRVKTLKNYTQCDDVFELAAMYLIAIARAHAFNDGNKRTSFQSASVFLVLNGYQLNPSSELVKLTIFAATGEAERGNTAFALKILSDYGDELMNENISRY